VGVRGNGPERLHDDHPIAALHMAEFLKMASKKWIWFAAAAATLGIAGIALTVSQLSECTYRESTPTFSRDQKYYYQMQFTFCRDEQKSQAALVLGDSSTAEEVVLLEVVPRFSSIDLAWTDEPALRVRIPSEAIRKRYSSYENFPKVVLELTSAD
jgi:hypothetical protein